MHTVVLGKGRHSSHKGPLALAVMGMVHGVTPALQPAVPCPPHAACHRDVPLPWAVAGRGPPGAQGHRQQLLQEQVSAGGSTSSLSHGSPCLTPSSFPRPSMEVGVCTEAYDQEMSVSRRHINSAFMTFVVLDEEGRPRTLPMVVPQPGVRTAVPL